MSLAINTNVTSMVAQNSLAKTQSALSTSFARLSSGLRINSASDDAAGLGISKSMNAQVRSYAVAERNTNDGISMLQTADGGAEEIHNIMTRMRELAVQASNGSLSANDYTNLDTEYQQQSAEIDRISSSVAFNGINLLGGASDVTSFANAQLSITALDGGIQTLSGVRAGFGAGMNRFANVVSNLQTMQTNTAASLSRIRDADIAAETANLSKNQVLSQAGAAILAQANQTPQLAMGLLKG